MFFEMKQSIITLVLVILLFFISLQSAFAAEGDIWLEPASQYAEENQDLIIEVHMDTGEKRVGVIDIYFDFNPQLISIRTEQFDQGVEKVVFFDISGKNVTNLQNGHFRIAGGNEDGFAGNNVHLLSFYIKTTPRFITSNQAILSLRVNQFSEPLGKDFSNVSISNAIIKNVNYSFPWQMFLLPIIGGGGDKIDCNGDLGGTATTDDCGVCDNNPANDNTTCTQDCNGNWGGTAYLDDCNTCVGGNTGKTPCALHTVISAGQVWMDRNLGASQVATSSTDSAAYGDLYQWGRLADGHESRTSPTTSTNSTIDVPGHGSFILETSSPYDWRTPQNDNLWQGVSGTNNPCPAGFRLPTEIDLETERASWNDNNSAGAFGSPLKLVEAGSRDHGDGTLGNVDIEGIYWSSTVSGIRSRLLAFNFLDTSMASDTRADGHSVRCIQDL